MKLFLVAILLITFSETSACSCITLPFDQHYQQSDFIAVAKISNIDSSLHERDQRDIEIEIITLYKGPMITKLKIDNHLRTNCGIYTPLNSTWLIFANKNKEGTFSFGDCSRSVQLDKVESRYYDTLSRSRFEASLSRMLNVLEFLKKYQNTFIRETNVQVHEKTWSDSSLKGFDEQAYNFAAYELIVEPEQTEHQIKTLKPFQNEVLTKSIQGHLKTAKVNPYSKEMPIRSAQRILILFFFYAKEDVHPSFVSRFFL